MGQGQGSVQGQDEITNRRVGDSTSYLSSARKNAPSRLGNGTFLPEMGRSYAPSRDGMFLRAEMRYDVLTRRAELGHSYAPSGDRTFLLPPDEVENFSIPRIDDTDKNFSLHQAVKKKYKTPRNLEDQLTLDRGPWENCQGHLMVPRSKHPALYFWYKK